MKKIIFLASLLLLTLFANAQKLKPSAVPAPAVAKLKSLYPNAEKAKWEKEGNNFEAEFENNDVETSCTFDASGNLVETEIEITVSQLPRACQDYVAQNLAGKKIKEASKITDAAGRITYEAEIDDMDYIFDENGQFIKSSKE